MLPLPADAQISDGQSRIDHGRPICRGCGPVGGFGHADIRRLRRGDWGANPKSASYRCDIISSDAGCNVRASAHGNSSGYAVPDVDIDTRADRAPDFSIHLNSHSLAGTNGDSHAHP